MKWNLARKIPHKISCRSRTGNRKWTDFQSFLLVLWRGKKRINLNRRPISTVILKKNRIISVHFLSFSRHFSSIVTGLQCHIVIQIIDKTNEWQYRKLHWINRYPILTSIYLTAHHRHKLLIALMMTWFIVKNVKVIRIQMPRLLHLALLRNISKVWRVIREYNLFSSRWTKNNRVYHKIANWTGFPLRVRAFG